MLTQIEDISDSMNRDIQKSNIKNKHTAVNIAFFDLSKMSSSMQAIYMVFAYSLLGAMIYFFYSRTVAKQEEEESKMLAKIEAKKAKKAAKKQN